METAVKYLIDRHLSQSRAFIGSSGTGAGSPGLKRFVSIGLTLIAEPGLADAIQEYNGSRRFKSC